MTDKLVPMIPSADSSLAPIHEIHAEAEDFIEAAKAENTWRAYRADWADFQHWCKARAVESLPAAAATIVLFLTERSRTHKISTLQRRLAAISQFHKAASLSDPTKSAEVRECWRGIRRKKGVAPLRKAPAVVEVIKKFINATPDGLQGARDRALILVGFAGALRRSELVALNVEDLLFGPDGLTITIRRSKTDQEGAGRQLGIPHGSNSFTCPVRNLKDWLMAAGIRSGAVFRAMTKHETVRAKRMSAQSVALIIKKYAHAAGLDARAFSGHSLRAGLATSAAMAGQDVLAIMQQTGHHSVEMVKRYVRSGNIFRNNVAGKIGL